MYIVKATMNPFPDGKLRHPITLWLRKRTMFGASYWAVDDKPHAHIFTSQRAARDAGREWRDRLGHREFEVIRIEPLG